VEESTSAVLRFAQGRIAAFTCSFGAARESVYEVVGSQAVLRSEQAYERSRAATHYIVADGQKEERIFPPQDQFARELIEFSECVLGAQDHPRASGEDGLADVRIIEALLRSAQTGRPVKLNPPS
jgi:glucose-fructose oxidoreductase